jgi:hypothetical protein
MVEAGGGEMVSGCGRVVELAWLGGGHVCSGCPVLLSGNRVTDVYSVKDPKPRLVEDLSSSS